MCLKHSGLIRIFQNTYRIVGRTSTYAVIIQLNHDCSRCRMSGCYSERTRTIRGSSHCVPYGSPSFSSLCMIRFLFGVVLFSGTNTMGMKSDASFSVVIPESRVLFTMETLLLGSRLYFFRQ